MKTRGILLAAFITTLLLTETAFTAAPAPDISVLEGPLIDGHTLKKDPDARFKKMWELMWEHRNDDPPEDGKPAAGTPADYVSRLDDFRKMFWATYPNGKEHEEAREAFAQALFLKDIHYLHSDLWIKNTLADTPSANANLHQDTPQNTIGQAIAQAFSSAALDGTFNPDGGIVKMALPEFEDWVAATRRTLRDSSRKSVFGQKLGTVLKTDFSLFGDDYRKACNFGGKEYQAYVLERDWAEFAAKNVIPGGFDNKQYYGQFLYCRFGQASVRDAGKIYDDMVDALRDRDLVESAAEKVLNARKTSGGMLALTVAEPYKLTPSGEKMPDYDVPVPKDVIGAYSNPLDAFVMLATRDDDRRYLLYLLKVKYEVNKPTTTRWAFSASAYDGLVKAFGAEDVRHAAGLVRTATKRFVHGTIMDPKAIGATRNDPFEAFEDILARKNPKGYILSALMFNASVESPASVDTDAAWKNLVATTGGGDEKTLLEQAAKMVLEKPNLASKNELNYITNVLAGKISLDKPAVGPLVDDPDYLSWKNFPAGAKVSYASRAWLLSPPGPDHMIPRAVDARYSYTLRSVTDDLAALWLTQIEIDYQSGASSKPHDMEVGYPAKRSLGNASDLSRRGRAKSKGGGDAPADAPAPQLPPRAAPTVPGAVALTSQHYPPPSTAVPESGDETLDINGRKILTHWQSLTYPMARTTSGTVTIKVWSSDEIPGHLVRKTEDRVTPIDKTNPRAQRVILETYLESFQGITPGTADPASTRTTDSNYSPPPSILAAAPAEAIPAHAAQTVQPTPATPPTPAPAPTPIAPKKTRGEPASPADIAAQKEIMKRFYAARTRDTQVSKQLDGPYRRPAADAPKLPPEITQARKDVNAELQATLKALAVKDNDEAQKQIQSAEDNLTLLEKYLNP